TCVTGRNTTTLRISCDPYPSCPGTGAANFQVHGTSGLNSLNYVLSGGTITTPIAGSVSVSGSTAQLLAGGLPCGSHSASFSGSPPSGIPCVATQLFNVAAGTTTTTDVTMVCGVPAPALPWRWLVGLFVTMTGVGMAALRHRKGHASANG